MDEASWLGIVLAGVAVIVLIFLVSLGQRKRQVTAKGIGSAIAVVFVLNMIMLAAMRSCN